MHRKNERVFPSLADPDRMDGIRESGREDTSVRRAGRETMNRLEVHLGEGGQLEHDNSAISG
jgi:hypothetical protein